VGENRRLARDAGRPGYADAVNRVPRNRATPSPPSAVRGAGFIVAVQGLAALVMAVILVLRAIAGADQRVVNGLGTALWFLLIGGVVLAAGRALVIGRRWGRGLAVFTQLLLLPVAWYLAVGSHQPAFGIPVAIVALTVVVLLFSPTALRWAAGEDQLPPANSASDGPDSR
jgi:peptidoglycan/LPS O-acetylase OafA/YrhL